MSFEGGETEAEAEGPLLLTAWKAATKFLRPKSTLVPGGWRFCECRVGQGGRFWKRLKSQNAMNCEQHSEDVAVTLFISKESVTVFFW